MNEIHQPSILLRRSVQHHAFWVNFGCSYQRELPLDSQNAPDILLPPPSSLLERGTATSLWFRLSHLHELEGRD